MLYIRTGKPGHGKTLNTIKEVDQKAHAEGRTVYFHNINGLQPEQLKASWYKFDDPEKWFELPNDSIIVVDEAQGWFGGRDPRARPPEHITRFETMRHSGHEVHLITQDPRYLDVHLRRLCNGHIHYWRVFKSQQLLRFESDSVIEKVEVKSSFKDAEKTTVRLDKKFFSVYTSSNAQHHFQTKLPTKFILAVLVIAGAVFMVYRAYERYEAGKQIEQAAAQAQPETSAPTGVVDQVKSSVGSLINPVNNKPGTKALSLDEYLAARVPRIPDVPSSAPIYDELTKPQSYPRLSCVMSSDEGYIDRNAKRYRVIRTQEKAFICECFTQQGSWHKTTFAYCKSTVERGVFDPARPDPGARPDLQQANNQPQQQPQQPQEAPKGVTVTRIPYEKGRFLW